MKASNVIGVFILFFLFCSVSSYFIENKDVSVLLAEIGLIGNVLCLMLYCFNYIIDTEFDD